MEKSLEKSMNQNLKESMNTVSNWLIAGGIQSRVNHGKIFRKKRESKSKEKA